MRELLEESLREAAQDPASMKRVNESVARMQADDNELNRVQRLDLTPHPRPRPPLAEQTSQGKPTKGRAADSSSKEMQLDITDLCEFQINGVTVSTGTLVGTRDELRRVLGSPAISVRGCTPEADRADPIDSALKRATRVGESDGAARTTFDSPVTLTIHNGSEFLDVVQNTGATCEAKGKICLGPQGKATATVTLSCKYGVARISLATDGALQLSAGPVSLNITGK